MPFWCPFLLTILIFSHFYSQKHFIQAPHTPSTYIYTTEDTDILGTHIHTEIIETFELSVILIIGLELCGRATYVFYYVTEIKVAGTIFVCVITVYLNVYNCIYAHVQ